jgi:hypothetical protein
MEKSAAWAAWAPSEPMMPTPTCAPRIMSTSLAPSPTASVHEVGTSRRTSFTTAAF